MPHTNVVHDLRIAWRGLRNAPGYTFIVAATLAGGFVAAFTIAILLFALVVRELPVDQPDRVALVTATDARGTPRAITAPVFDLLSRQQTTLDTMALHTGGIALPVEVGGEINSIPVAAVTAEYFHALRIDPVRGRLFSPAELGPSWDEAAVAVVTHRFWTRHYGDGQEALGATVKVSGMTLAVIGVTPPGFEGIHVDAGVNMFVPLGLLRRMQAAPAQTIRANNIVVRLRDRATIAQAVAEVRALWRSLQVGNSVAALSRSELSDFQQQQIDVVSARTGISRLRNSYSTVLYALAGPAVLVFAVACANVMGLLLVRSLTRRREVAVCLAMGGSRWAFVRQLTFENLLVAAAVVWPAWLVARFAGTAIATELGEPDAAGARHDGGLAPEDRNRCHCHRRGLRHRCDSRVGNNAAGRDRQPDIGEDHRAACRARGGDGGRGPNRAVDRADLRGRRSREEPREPANHRRWLRNEWPPVGGGRVTA